MPAGLTLAGDGTISGTPTANGRARLTIAASTATDCNGNAIYTLNVGAPRWLAIGPDSGGAANLKTFDGAGQPLAGPLVSLLAAPPSYRGGVRVAVGDVNGDGVFDLVGGAGPGVGPIVAVFDGATGAMLHTFFAFDPRFTGGVHVAAGDVSGDGLADVIVGAGEGGAPAV